MKFKVLRNHRNGHAPAHATATTNCETMFPTALSATLLPKRNVSSAWSIQSPTIVTLATRTHMGTLAKRSGDAFNRTGSKAKPIKAAARESARRRFPKNVAPIMIRKPLTIMPSAKTSAIHESTRVSLIDEQLKTTAGRLVSRRRGASISLSGQSRYTAI